MGRLLDKNSCTGCMACKNVCPIKCIEVEQDTRGFYVPHIDTLKCVKCGMCESACKKANNTGINKPVFAKSFTTNDAEVLSRSSSGGAFTAFATMILKQEGKVYGAAYDEVFSVRHIRTETMEELKKLNGSKYVQSDIGECFKLVEKDLKAGYKVLFSGTPCQVAGLDAYIPSHLKENLLMIDFICHGVPSPKVWEKYLKYLQDKECGQILSVNMRDHRISQEEFGMCVVGEDKEYFSRCIKDPFLVAFLSNLILRESCFNCKHKKLECHSDITIADLWGGEQLLPKEKYNGHHSLVISNSSKGSEFIEYLSDYGTVDSVSLKKSLMVNTSRLFSSTKVPSNVREHAICEMEQGKYDTVFTVAKKSESLLSRMKRKVTVFYKCLFINENRIN